MPFCFSHSGQRAVGFGLAAVLLALLGLLPLGAEESAGKQGRLLDESWTIIFLQGKRVGFSSSIQTERTTPQGKQYVTEVYEELALKRMGLTLRMINQSTITEDERGQIVNFESVNRGSGTNKKVRGYRVGDELVELSGNRKRSYPFPADALGPRAAENALKQMPLQPGEKKTLNTFMPDTPGQAVSQAYQVIDKTSVEVEGKRQKLWKLSSQISLLPGITGDVFVNDRYEVQLMQMPLPAIGTLEMVTTTREKAMAKLEAAEVFANTLVQPNRPLPNYQTLKRARFKLKTNPPNKNLPLYDGESQRVVERRADGSVIIETTLPNLQPGDASYALPAKSTKELAPYLQPSTYVEVTPEIKKLARKAVGGETNPVLAAKKISAFVRGFIRRKNLGVGFASAAETAASRQGDCTEHAVLCAALGRAVGLPTRVVTGFGYLPTDYAGSGDPSRGTFGYHMWAEAYVAPGKWAPMDAALGEFTVCHLAISKSPLDEANPFVKLSLPIFDLLNGLQIDVLDTE